jgi:hypothetical protein
VGPGAAGGAGRAQAPSQPDGRACAAGFRTDRPLILHTVFAGFGISGILGQLDDDGLEYLCAAVSRPLNVHEKRYDSYKGELPAVVWACMTLCPYLATRQLTVVTDHAPLLRLMSAQDGLPAQYARCALQLQAFAFDVTHRRRNCTRTLTL